MKAKAEDLQTRFGQAFRRFLLVLNLRTLPSLCLDST